MKNKFKNLLWLFLAIFVIAFDQLSKFFVMKYLSYQTPKKIFPFLNLYFSHNYGAAFSFLYQSPNFSNWLFSSIAIIVSLIIIFWLYRAHEKRYLLKISLMLVLGGAVGNLIDRIVFGYVRDFLDFYIQNVGHWPTFNIADSAICVGVVILFLSSFLGESKNKKRYK